MVRILIVLACCGAALGAVRMPGASDCKPLASEPDALWIPGGRIVGGVKAAAQSWPWIGGMIQQKDGYYPGQFCGGTLIANQWFVTAGHCVDSMSEEEAVNTVRIALGVNNLNDVIDPIKGTIKEQAVSRVAGLFKHDQYDVPYGSTNNDIALIKLERPVTFSSKIRPACLPSKPANDTSSYYNIDKIANRPMTFVAGWGHTSEGQERLMKNDGTPNVGAGTEQLQQVNIAMYKENECKSKLRGYAFTDRMICGGFEQGGKDSCQGDSGGPLVRKDEQGKWVLTGVVSWGAGCARRAMPGIYADVFALKKWILDTIQNNS